MEHHVIHAATLIELATAGTGVTWRLGRLWAKLPFVSRNHWLI